MFIHIGDSNVISTEDIISIVDYTIISSSVIMEELMQERKQIGPKEDVKSVVITNDIVYLSTLAVSTLTKRASLISTINKLDDYSENLEID